MTERMERHEKRARTLELIREARALERRRLALERLARAERESDELRQIGGYAAFVELGRRWGLRK